MHFIIPMMSVCYHFVCNCLSCFVHLFVVTECKIKKRKSWTAVTGLAALSMVCRKFYCQHVILLTGLLHLDVLPGPWPQWVWSSGPALLLCRCRGSGFFQKPSPVPPAALLWMWSDSCAASSWGGGQALTPHLTLHPSDCLEKHKCLQIRYKVCIHTCNTKMALNKVHTSAMVPQSNFVLIHSPFLFTDQHQKLLGQDPSSIQVLWIFIY